MKGEKLITKTFFSIGEPGHLSIKERKVIMQQTDEGEFESRKIVVASNKPTKRNLKAANKMKERDRKQLLISLYPYIDESKLANNLKKECGILPLWEDEQLSY